MRGIIVGILFALVACGGSSGGGGDPEPPVIAGGSLTTDEDTAAAYTVEASDPKGRALVLEAQPPQHGAVSIDQLRVTYTPAANYHGPDSFAVTVSNGETFASAQIDVMVRSVNDAPTATGDSFAALEDIPLVRPLSALLVNDLDVDGDPLAVMAVQGATNGAAAIAGTNVTFTPAANFSGMASFQYTVGDGTMTATATVTITVGGVNDAPIAADDTAATQEDTPVDVAGSALIANDTDSESQTLTVIAVGSPTHGAVTLAGGTATFTPAANYSGPATFEYTVSDGAATATGRVAVTVGAVNDAPVAADDTTATPEDTALQLTSSALVANDADIDGPSLAVTQVGNAINGAVVLAGGIATFTPAANYSGAGSFEYTVSDGAATDTGRVTINVSAVNDPPVATDDTTATAEDTLLVIAPASLLANDADVDGPSLVVTQVGGATNGTVVLVGGNVRFTPAANFSGAASFTYTLSDGTAVDTGAVLVNVTAVNDAPVAADDSTTTPEDTALQLTSSALVANDTDADGPGLAVTQVGNAINGAVVLAGGIATFTPAANFSGAGSFEYTVSDGAATDTGRVTVNVTAVNDPPVATDDTAAAVEDTLLVIALASLLANDTDIDGPSLVVIQVGNATNGTVALAGGNVRFTPAANFNGAASFTYTLSDGAAIDTGAVLVNVTAVNDAPVAIDDSATTPEDTALQLTSSALVANDTDVDGPSLAVTQVGNAINGAVVLAGGIATFTPAANYSGAGSFEYTVSDGVVTDTGRVTINVTAVNDPPVATDDPASTAEDTLVVITLASLLANDTDIDGPSLAVTQVGNATNGTVALTGGNVTFTPAANFNGAAGFTYTLSDGAAIDTGAVTVSVTAVNDPPVAADDVNTVVTGSSLVLSKASLLANDTDIDGPALAVTAVQNAVHGIAVLGATTVTFTPTAGYSGPASFDYVVSDGIAGDVGRVAITVQPRCGDGVIHPPETCDDGNPGAGDGCSAACIVEIGWTCAGTPSLCTPICGDGMRVGDEVCDDGNANQTDGCTTQCVIGALCTAAALPGGDRFAVDPATGHCYASFDGELTTFGVAQEACAAAGGYLVTIRSAGEQALAHAVQNLVQNPWIGAEEDANDADAIFDWVTDESFGFASFAPGQPDDDAAVDGNGDCLHLFNAAGQWNDTNCDFSTFVIGRICEVEPQPCGDSIRQLAIGEECDDGNTTSGDGCSATCQFEDGCGDGNLDPGEECDDDNRIDGDGCSSSCEQE